jgi:hypothetical protein
MEKVRFDKAFAKFIHHGDDKIKPTTFFRILAAIEQERIERTINLRAKIIEGKLHFEPSPDISVHDNEIILGSQRIVVEML